MFIIIGLGPCDSPKRVFLLLLGVSFYNTELESDREWARDTEDQGKDLMKEAKSIVLLLLGCFVIHEEGIEKCKVAEGDMKCWWVIQKGFAKDTNQSILRSTFDGLERASLNAGQCRIRATWSYRGLHEHYKKATWSSSLIQFITIILNIGWIMAPSFTPSSLDHIWTSECSRIGLCMPLCNRTYLLFTHPVGF